MALSERSFIDRHDKGMRLVTACDLMEPVFTPADSALSIENFTTFLDTVAAANSDVATKDTAFSTLVTGRSTASDAAQLLVTQVVSYVKSNSAWKLVFPNIKKLGDKVRGIKPSRKIEKPPAPQPGQPAPPPVKTRDRGDGSYVEIAANFKSFVSAVGTAVGYNPPDDKIKIAQLATLAEALAANNEAVSTADQALDTAQRKRYALFYDRETGLMVKFQLGKAAVKGQYGLASQEYQTVKMIKW